MCVQVTEHMAGWHSLSVGGQDSTYEVSSLLLLLLAVGCSRNFCSYTNLPFSNGFAEKPLVI
jgi:hypothetical protein